MKSKIEKAKLVTIATVAIIAIIGYFIIYPEIENIYKNVNEIIKQKQELRAYTSVTPNSTENKLINSFIEDTDKLESAILKKGEEIELVNTLEQLAAEKGVSQKIIILNGENKQKSSSRTTTTTLNSQPAEKLEGTELEIIKFQIETGSSFETLLKYLTALEHTELYINITNVQITRASESGEEIVVPDNGVKAVIDAITYIRT